ncbi:TerD family protein [Paraoerskovia marina]|uniref:Tellurium resistance protein TerD n=1 Tax=Paraoerskovia marina TaxID=545619 RepID=A0A1H1NXA4_9CELL|nr:TerD family protein [Paraoerskovia marina]SDS03425.1 tellurium resistance protein TerD [Paraoerskovia marina]
MSTGGIARGGNVSLTKENPGLSAVAVGVEWDRTLEPALAESLTLAAVLCGADGRAVGRESLVFWNQMTSSDLSVAALDSALGHDVEQVEVFLADVPDTVSKVVFVLYVNEGSPRRRTLGQLSTCRVRVLDAESGRPLASSENLAASFGTETAVLLGEVYRHREHWKFKVVGQGYSAGLRGVTDEFGLTS